MDQETKQRRRIKFTTEEDEMLRNLVEQYGEGSWTQISSNMPGRNVRQCRERWKHYLSASKSGRVPFTEEEDRIIIEKYIELGPKWTKIAKYVKDRSDIQIKARVAKKISSFRQTINTNPQTLNQQIQTQTLKQPLETQPDPMLSTNISTTAQDNNKQLAIPPEKIEKKEEKDVIMNIPLSYYDLPTDFFNQPVNTPIEDSQNAENIYYPYEFYT